MTEGRLWSAAAHRRSHRLHLHQRRAELGTCDHREPGAAGQFRWRRGPACVARSSPANRYSAVTAFRAGVQCYEGVQRLGNPQHRGGGSRGERQDQSGRCARLRVRKLKRHGSVKDGTALTDTAPEEIERGYSINLGPRVRRVAGHQDQPHRHTRVSRLPGRRGRRTRRRRRSALRHPRDGRRRDGHRAHVPRSRQAPRSRALRRLDDGQGARRLRSHLPADQARLTTKVIPVEIPIGEGADFHGIVNLFTRARTSSSAA